MLNPLPLGRMIKMRKHEISRDTAETKIKLALDLDGSGEVKTQTKVGFLDHMLTLFASHGLFDLDVFCDGDVEVDDHHTTEDIGIALGQAFKQAIGTKEGITRYGSFTVLMDETKATVDIDISGRPFLVYHVEGLKDKVGSFDTELVEEFFHGFTNHAFVTLHINVHYGSNTHHIIEAIFKAFGRALDQATLINPRVKGVPSTKGLL